MEENNNYNNENENLGNENHSDSENNSNESKKPYDEVEGDFAWSSSEEAKAFNWGYTDEEHIPINFDNEISKPQKKKNAKRFTIIIGIVFVAAMILLAAAIVSDLKFATPDDIKGQTNVNIQVSDSSPSMLETGAVNPEALEDFKNSTVVVTCDSNTGTGIIFTTDGYIVTNYHVVEDASSIQVSLYNGSTYKATLIGHVSANDIAVLKINATGLRAATFAKSESCYVTQRVYAVGTPAGASFAWSVSSGIISATNREAKFYNENNMLERKMTVIQTDAPVNPGNSGGPLINANCEVVGIITMRLANDYVGMGFAIPSDNAVSLITQILSGNGDEMKESSVTKPTPQIGISGFDGEKGVYYSADSTGRITRVSESFAAKFPESCFVPKADGIYILSLTPGLDAETKLQVGDVIVDIERSGNNSMSYLKKALENKKVGDKITLTINRNGEEIDVKIVLK